jgi:hypothetical protein
LEVFIADSSGLAPRYVAEDGSEWVQTVLDPLSGNVAIIARIGAAELIAAVTRRKRGGSLDPGDAAIARAEFRSRLAPEYQVVD